MPREDSKTCSKCGKRKPLGEYWKQADCRDGLRPYCKACMNANHKAWYAENREANLAYQAEWGEKNRERRLAYVKAWKKLNAEKVRENGRKRRALLEGTFVTDVYLDEILLRDLGVCGICGESIMDELHLDHIVPLVAGGTHEPQNVQLAHATCNLRKSAKLDFSLAPSPTL